jgi:uncharacterized protein (TIGR00369 family)
MFTNPMADLKGLEEHLEGSAVESGLGTQPLSVEPGRVTARMPLNSRTRLPDGRPHPAALSAFADFGIGVAINSAVVGSTGGPTVELTVTHVAPPHPRAKALCLVAEALSVTPLSGTGRSEIRDDLGTVVATVVGVMATSSSGMAPTGVPAGRRFDPTAMTIEAVADDFSHVRFAVDLSMINNRGMVHGGVLAGMVAMAQDAFAGAGRQRLSFAMQFLRPAPPDVGVLACRTSYVRRGRRFHTVRTVLERPDGSTAAEGTGTTVQPE